MSGQRPLCILSPFLRLSGDRKHAGRLHWPAASRAGLSGWEPHALGRTKFIQAMLASPLGFKINFFKAIFNKNNKILFPFLWNSFFFILFNLDEERSYDYWLFQCQSMLWWTRTRGIQVLWLLLTPCLKIMNNFIEKKVLSCSKQGEFTWCSNVAGHITVILMSYILV